MSVADSDIERGLTPDSDPSRTPSAAASPAGSSKSAANEGSAARRPNAANNSQFVITPGSSMTITVDSENKRRLGCPAVVEHEYSIFAHSSPIELFSGAKLEIRYPCSDVVDNQSLLRMNNNTSLCNLIQDKSCPRIHMAFPVRQLHLPNVFRKVSVTISIDPYSNNNIVAEQLQTYLGSAAKSLIVYQITMKNLKCPTDMTPHHVTVSAPKFFVEQQEESRKKTGMRPFKGVPPTSARTVAAGFVPIPESENLISWVQPWSNFKVPEDQEEQAAPSSSSSSSSSNSNNKSFTSAAPASASSSGWSTAAGSAAAAGSGQKQSPSQSQSSAASAVGGERVAVQNRLPELRPVIHGQNIGQEQVVFEVNPDLVNHDNYTRMMSVDFSIRDILGEISLKTVTNVVVKDLDRKPLPSGAAQPKLSVNCYQITVTDNKTAAEHLLWFWIHGGRDLCKKLLTDQSVTDASIETILHGEKESETSGTLILNIPACCVLSFMGDITGKYNYNNLIMPLCDDVRDPATNKITGSTKTSVFFQLEPLDKDQANDQKAYYNGQLTKHVDRKCMIEFSFWGDARTDNCQRVESSDFQKLFSYARTKLTEADLAAEVERSRNR